MMPSSATMIADCRPPKLSVRRLELAARHVGVAARPLHLIEPFEHGLGHAIRVVAALHFRIDRDGALAVVAMNLASARS